MLPPLFLDPKCGELVFDSCAAPGSKTTQILEMMEQDGDNDGAVIANDADIKRAYLLLH